MSSALPADAPRPRLCHIRKWPDSEGYGFNLQAEKGKPGHFLGKVDPGSVSDAGGLEEGDLIVEVNGTNISNENHQQVVQRIKAVKDEVKLLVTDRVASEFYARMGIVVHSGMPNVQCIATPESRAEFEADPRAGYSADPPSATTDTEVEPSPRLCILRLWPDFQGYGFNLTAEKNKPGQFIGKVDNDSPASTAGLREGDRIIEVNGVNVTEDSHQEVVGRIKTNPGSVSLFVVDRETDDFYKKRGTVVRSDMPNVIRGETPERSSGDSDPPPLPTTPVPDEEDEAPRKIVATAAVVAATEPEPEPEPEPEVIEQNEPEPEEQSVPEPEPELQSVPEPEPELQSVPEPEPEVQSAPDTTAEEEAMKELEEASASHDEQDSPMYQNIAVASAFAAAVPEDDDDAPRPRLCTVKSWRHFKGYGFNLQASKESEGHYIGSVDNDSPAKAGGLKGKDKIVEVNGSNVTEDSHRGVVEKIKAKPGVVTMLVVDEETEKYYMEKSIKIHSDMKNVEVIECPDDAGAAPVTSDSDGPSLRLCIVKKWTTFQGYGFNLNAEKGRVGNFIGGIDSGSPAEAAGVKKNDLIIEVNGCDVAESDHKMVVSQILKNPSEVRLLLIDPDSAKYYKNKGTKISGSLPNIVTITCPDKAPDNVQTNGYSDVQTDTKPATQSSGSFAIRSSAPSTEGEDPLAGSSFQEVLNRVKSRKKPAARTGNLSMKEKFELFQQL